MISIKCNELEAVLQVCIVDDSLFCAKSIFRVDSGRLKTISDMPISISLIVFTNNNIYNIIKNII